MPGPLRTTSSVRTAALAATAVVVLGAVAVLAAHVADPLPPPVRRVAPGQRLIPPAATTSSGGLPWWFLVGVLVFTLLAGALLFFALRDGLLVGRRDDTHEDAAFRIVEHDRHLAAERAAKAARDALLEAADSLDTGADPREVVVACWVRLETAAEHRGEGRRPAETATDVARRWLAHSGDRTAVDDLAALFHEARYSTHALTDAHRTRARTALARCLGVAA